MPGRYYIFCFSLFSFWHLQSLRFTFVQQLLVCPATNTSPLTGSITKTDWSRKCKNSIFSAFRNVVMEMEHCLMEILRYRWPPFGRYQKQSVYCIQILKNSTFISDFVFKTNNSPQNTKRCPLIRIFQLFFPISSVIFNIT